MAALRHGIRTVIIPQDNEKDLQEIDPVVLNALNFVTATDIDTVLRTALNLNTEVHTTLLKDMPGQLKGHTQKPSIQQ